MMGRPWAIIVAVGLCAAPQAQGGTLTLHRIDASPAPISVRAAPEGSPASGYVLSLSGGALRAIEPDGTLRPTAALAGITDPGGERLGNVWDIAFAPDHATSGKAYLSFTVFTGDGSERRFNHVVAEVTRDAGDPSRFDPASLRRILTVPHTDARPGGAHFGGAIDFGPDGMLYVTTGDSWLSRSAPPTGAQNVSQDPTDPRGAVLRIDPRSDAFPDDPLQNYALPGDNPDFGPDADPALWAIGLRNPFKARWDLETARLFIADVGEDGWEEVNLGLAGANYGWPAWEGPDELAPGELAPLGTLTGPLYAYSHDLSSVFGGKSITGGEVYRGPLGELYGQYLFADYLGNELGGRMWSFDALSEPGDIRNLTAWSLEVTGGGTADRIIGMGSDAAGRFYVADQRGGLFLVGLAAQVAVIPLPGSLGLALGGLALLGGLGRVRRRG